MKLSKARDNSCNEIDIIEDLFSLDDKEILDLGCGKADMTRLLANKGYGRNITATEVDEVQHNKNILVDDLPNVTFMRAGAEEIPLTDESFDYAFMFKSLHHVPLDLMQDALTEVKRVLKTDGVAYISEPVFAGDFNEILRLFHDEEHVRSAAQSAIKNSIDEENFFLIDEILFNIPLSFDSFEEFETKVINVTHTEHRLSSELLQRVKDQFSLYSDKDGAKFLMPMRVNLLQKIK